MEVPVLIIFLVSVLSLYDMICHGLDRKAKGGKKQ
jgi:hypothetical protein